MPRGYGNSSDPPPPSRDDSVDQPHPKHSMSHRIAATLSPAKRDTPANRRMAKQNGWTDKQFEDWVNGSNDADAGIRDG